jgi:hypothetical protein
VRSEKKFVVIPFFVVINFKKIEKLFYFSNAEENNLGKFSKNYRTFYPKNCHSALKNMGLGSGLRDPGSGIRKKPLPDPGSRGQKSTRSQIPDPRFRIPDPGFRIPDPDPQHWLLH